MTTTIHIPDGMTLEDYIDKLVDERIVSHLTEHMRLDISTNWYQPHEKEIKLYYKDTVIAWDYLYIPN